MKTLKKHLAVIISILVFGSVFSTNVAAQEKKTRFGIQAGIGFAGFGGDDIGYDLGVFGVTSVMYH